METRDIRGKLCTSFVGEPIDGPTDEPIDGPTDGPIDRRIAALVAGQHGLATTAQLEAVGLTQNAIGHRCLAGRLHRIHRGVFAVGHADISHDAGLLAAVLAVGEDAAVSHLSAAVLWALLRREHSGAAATPDVSVPRRLTRRRGICVHYANLRPPDITSLRGIPVTTPARTLVDLAGVVPGNWLRRAVREAEVQRLVDLGDLHVPRGCRGAQQLREILDIGPAPTRSELEDLTLDLLLRNGLPRPLVNAKVRTATRTYEVDFLFCDERVIVEADGDRYHGTRLAREDDRAKEAALEIAGYRVLHVSWRQVVEAEGQTVSRVRRALERARNPPGLSRAAMPA